MVPLSLISECTKNLASEHAEVVPISLFVAVLCLCLVIGHLLEENRWINESIVAIIIVSFILSVISYASFLFIMYDPLLTEQ